MRDTRIALRRVGDFWIAYGEDAHIMAEALDIALTTDRKTGKSMAGIPAQRLDDWVRDLAQAGVKASFPIETRK